jgi:hypothetical protein
MPITTANDWFAAAKQAIQIRKTAVATTAGAQPVSTLDLAGTPGAGSLAIGNTTSGVVPTDATAGFPTINAFGGGAIGYLSAARFRNAVAGGCILYDRLWHAGSVSMTALATTTFAGQPSYTGRLPGGTDFGNLEIIIEINVAVSATATTIAVGYTNEAGTTGRSTGASVSLSGVGSRRCILMPLQAGDKGVQRIDSVTVGGVVATTGTFNVMVARRLAEFDIRVANGLDPQGWDLTGGPQLFADSALWPMLQPDSTSSGLYTLALDIING